MKFSYQHCKDGVFAFLARTAFVLKDRSGEATLGDLPPFKVAEFIVGGTTFLVSSFFKKDAKGSVVDKISRLIERDALSITEKEEISNTTGMSSR